MRFPSIHLNGTSFAALNTEYRAAYDAVDDALKALQKVTVHGRDYYVQQSVSGDPACEAIEEHRKRLTALETIKTELVQIILHIEKQHRGD